MFSQYVFYSTNDDRSVEEIICEVVHLVILSESIGIFVTRSFSQQCAGINNFSRKNVK